MFLFQFLKLFEGGGETGERLGAIVIPGLIVGMLFLMPLFGRWKLGHRFNTGFTLGLLVGIGVLTGMAVREDYQSKWSDGAQFAEIAKLSQDLGHDDAKISAHFGGDKAKIVDYQSRLKQFEAYRKSADFLTAVKQANADSERAVELAGGPNGIPPAGARELMRNDAMTEGPRLFAQYCASCHTHFNPKEIDSPAAKEQLAKASASNLYGFGSHRWVAGLLNAKEISSPQYFGCTTRFKELKAKDKSLEMIDYVNSDVSQWPAEEVKSIVAALSAQAQLPAQREVDAKDQSIIAAGEKLIADESRCATCHRFKPDLAFNDPKLLENEMDAPDLTHYASRDWLIGMISNPAAPRFYGKKNDRMPAFAPEADEMRGKNILSRQQIKLIVDWLHGEGPGFGIQGSESGVKDSVKR